jgi:hypothetical protein
MPDYPPRSDCFGENFSAARGSSSRRRWPTFSSNRKTYPQSGKNFCPHLTNLPARSSTWASWARPAYFARASPPRGQNRRHRLVGLLRQSVFGRLAGYEDVNDADLLWPRVGDRAITGAAASAQPDGRYRDKAGRCVLAFLRWSSPDHLDRPQPLITPAYHRVRNTGVIRSDRNPSRSPGSRTVLGFSVTVFRLAGSFQPGPHHC